jgi:hypothetical protein
MLETDMKEKLDGRMVLEDIGSEAINAVLEWVYTGCLDLAGVKKLNFCVINEILFAADKVELEETFGYEGS